MTKHNAKYKTNDRKKNPTQVGFLVLEDISNLAFDGVNIVKYSIYQHLVSIC